MRILSDIGGTFVRFAVEESGIPEQVKKYTAVDFVSFEAALETYLEEIGQGKAKGSLAIATAAYDDNGLWRFVNRNEWVLDPAAIKQAGWEPEIILNDFEAASWALVSPETLDLEIIKEGQGFNDSMARCLMGPGTGLGLGYLIPLAKNKHHVQKTHGGHVLASSLTDEQHLIIETYKGLNNSERVPAFESFVSGPGLQNLYQAVCRITGQDDRAERAEYILQNTDNAEVKAALRLFHEFLGLFAQSAVVCGHAYGGLFLTGGMIERLDEKDLFDFNSFEKYFVLDCVDSVKHDLDETKVALVKEPYLAMKGLCEALNA